MTDIVDRYPDDGCAARLYRSLRLRHAGLAPLAARFPDAGLIVDLGCGMGLLAHLLVEGQPGREVLAVDHDPERIHALLASAAGLPIRVRVDDLASMDLPHAAGIALVDVLHYFTRDVQEDLLARAADVLAPGGVLLLRDPDAAAGWRFRAARLHERLAVGLGWTQAELGTYRSAEEWAFLLRASGLEAEVLPLRCASPYADRVVIGRRP